MTVYARGHPWRGRLLWGWMLEVPLLTIAGLMFRIRSATVPSGGITFTLCTLISVSVAFVGDASTRADIVDQQ